MAYALGWRDISQSASTISTSFAPPFWGGRIIGLVKRVGLSDGVSHCHRRSSPDPGKVLDSRNVVMRMVDERPTQYGRKHQSEQMEE